MEPEHPFIWNSKISAESRISHRSSIRSLDRGSWEERVPSLSKPHNMIEVMSLEGSKKSDIYQKMLAQEPVKKVQRSEFKQSQGKEQVFNPFKTVFKPAVEPMSNRFSYQAKQEINHICTCYGYCNQDRCPCSLAKDEECQQNFCCPQCIQNKMKKMVRSGMPDPKLFCTCKKTKCNKKYCTCFAAGVKCGYNCTCEDCLNCDRPVKIEVEPNCIVDEDIKRLDMPESMEFQPFAFRYSKESNK